MQSFSNRLAVTAPEQANDQAPDTAAADRATGIAAGDTGDTPEPVVLPSDGHDASEDVDFDAAIAEVLMTLAADQGHVVEPRATNHHDGAIHGPARQERQDATSSDDEDQHYLEGTDSDDAPLDPEAALAAEAATFRLLGELERLWHGAA